jgi:lipopolysaccharide export system permease protein
MPVLWRYLLKSYLQMFLLSVVGFVAVLLVTRLQEIARFAATSASFSKASLFTLYQIPYILPLALPISCLISALLLYQKLSHNHELTAIRASGLGLYHLSHPILLAGACLSLINFAFTAEITPRARALSNQLIHSIAAENPLVIMNGDSIVRIKDLYIQADTSDDGKIAKQALVVAKNHSSERLSLMLAKELYLSNATIYGKQVQFISSIESADAEGFDHLIIENQATMNTDASTLSSHLITAGWLKKSEYLPLKLLIAKDCIEQSSFEAGSRLARNEISKRVTLGLAPLSFTLIGTSYGMELGRLKRKKGLIKAVALAAFFMVCFVATKSLKTSPLAALACYLLPHPIIAWCSLRHWKRLNKGNE